MGQPECPFEVCGHIWSLGEHLAAWLCDFSLATLACMRWCAYQSPVEYDDVLIGLIKMRNEARRDDLGGQGTNG